MTSYPQPSKPAGPSKTWTWIGVGLLVLAVVLTGFFVWKVVETVPRTPQSIGVGMFHLDQEGLTIYSPHPIMPPACLASDSTGANVPLKRPSGSETITINSKTWYVVSRSVEPVPAGDYLVTCFGSDRNVTYAVGQRSSVLSFVGAIFGAIASFVILGIAGVLILVISGLKRRRANHPPSNTFPGGGSPYPQGGNPYPQGGNPYPQGGNPYPQGGNPYPGSNTFPAQRPGQQGQHPTDS
jgi:hypothetical protein